MKKILITTIVLALVFSLIPTSNAGDCKTRDQVNWHATITTAVNVRIDCDDHAGPVGDVVGVVPGGEVVRILEVDRFKENYIIESSVGTGFVFSSFLKDINKWPLPGAEVYEDSVFPDLDLDHMYYFEIADLKTRKRVISFI